MARSSRPMASPTRSSNSGSHVAPRAIDTGKQVALPTTAPRGPSLNRMPGKPMRSTSAADERSLVVAVVAPEEDESGPRRRVAVEAPQPFFAASAWRRATERHHRPTLRRPPRRGASAKFSIMVRRLPHPRTAACGTVDPSAGSPRDSDAGRREDRRRRRDRTAGVRRRDADSRHRPRGGASTISASSSRIRPNVSAPTDNSFDRSATPKRPSRPRTLGPGCSSALGQKIGVTNAIGVTG